VHPVNQFPDLHPRPKEADTEDDCAEQTPAGHGSPRLTRLAAIAVLWYRRAVWWMSGKNAASLLAGETTY
jgi:hypothetical protein